MRRHEAKDLVYQNGYTAGELANHLLDKMDLADARPSRINKQMTRAQVWDILYKAVSAEPFEFRYDQGHRSRVLTAANVLREFGIPVREPAPAKPEPEDG